MDLLLAASAAPEQGLHFFTRLREMQPAAFDRLVRSPAGLRHLVAIFTQSHCLSEDLLLHPNWSEQLREPNLHGVLTAEEMSEDLEASIPPGVPDPLELAMFRRRHILRVVARDVLGMGSLPEITGELSSLADVLIETAYDRIHRSLVTRYGQPRADTGSFGGLAHFAVIALGKLGGAELNYSSDIDLMFVYSANGSTEGPESIGNQEFFKRAANQLTALLSTYTAEGMC